MLQNDTQMGLLSVLPQCWSAGHGSATLKLCFFRFFGDPQRGHRVLSLVGGSIYIYMLGGLDHLDYFPIQLGMSKSQLTISYFSEGVGLKPPSNIDSIATVDLPSSKATA